LRIAANIASAYGMRVETLAAALTPNVKVRGAPHERKL